jgi:autotransporter-associated beta strand protein
MICVERKRKSFMRIQAALAPVAALLVGTNSARASGPYNTVSFSSVSTNAYGAQDTNSCSVDINNLITIDDFQYIAYYNNSGHVVLGRRAASSSADNTNPWTLDTTTLTASAATGGVADDHHTISIAIDGNDEMHLSWGMHNDPFNYGISTNSVTGATFAPTFTIESQATMESWFPELDSVDQITYPQFYNIPNSGNLLLAYRDAASTSGGGSGNGNEYFAVYNATTKTYSSATNVEMLNGGITSVNGYMNNLVYTPSGNLLASWTWRATPNWQTNSNLLFAESPNNGASWTEQNGTPYGLPIIQNTSDGGTASQVAQSVYNIPEGDSYINQTSMTIDNNGNPMVATYMTPGYTPTSSDTGSGNPNRQYVLYFYNGSSWQQSVVSNRTSDTSIDTSGNDVRDLGRPLVLVDKSNRVLLVTRSENTSMGSFANAGTPNNDIVIYYSTVAALDSGAPNWRSVTLDTTNLGQLEPTYDPGLWAQSNVLNLIYEPVGLSGEGQNTIQVMQWDENTFFADGITWDNAGATAPGEIADGLTWDSENNNNWSNGSVATGIATAVNYMNGDNVTFNDTNNGHYHVTLNTTVTPGNITVNNTLGNYVISGTGGIAGSGALTKSGNATLTLSTLNTYTGGTTISAGTLSFANGALGSGGITFSGSSTLQWNGTNTQDISSQIQPIASGVTATFDTQANNVTLASALSGMGGIVKVGTGALTLAGNNAFSGGATLSSGQLNINNATALGSGTFTINGGTIDNTSSGPISLTSNNAQTWGSDFTFVGSNSLNLGAGAVTLGANRNVTVLGSTLTVGGVIGDSGHGYSLTKSGAGTLDLAAGNTYTGGTVVNAGALVIGAAGALPANSSLAINGSALTQLATNTGETTVSSLAIANGTGAQLDVGNNNVLLSYGATDPKTTILQYLATGSNGGLWNGPGINSSAAAANSAYGVAFSDGADGVNTALVSGQIEVAYALNGDINLDGVVNGTDFGILAANFGDTVSNGWEQADFNYDGVVNGSDFGLLAANFGQAANGADTILPATDWEALDAFAQANGLLADVPEPTSICALNLGLLGLLARRRRPGHHSTASASSRTNA